VTGRPVGEQTHGRASEQAVEAASWAEATEHGHLGSAARAILAAAHDPALGLQRSVCLGAFLDEFIGPTICSKHRNREGGDDCPRCNPPTLHDLITEHRRIEREHVVTDVVEALRSSDELSALGAVSVAVDVAERFGKGDG
jgi:hypothetical protein